MKRKKPYQPNNWQAYKDSPPEWFESITFEEFESWKIAGWQIPSSIDCIIRVTDLETGKIKEHVYSKRGNAENKVKKLMSQGLHEFVVCDHENVHHLFPITPDEKKNSRNKAG